MLEGQGSGGDLHGCPRIIGNGDIFSRQVVKDHRLPNIWVAEENDLGHRGTGLFGLGAAAIHPLSLPFGGLRCRATLRTVAIKLHPMVKSLEAVPLGDISLKCFQGLVFKFNNLTAPEADEVIVMAPSRDRFVPGLSVSKFAFLGQTEAGEKLQGSINRRITNPRIGLRYQGIDLSKILVPRGAQKDIENLLSLLGRLQPAVRNRRFELIGSNGTPPY